MRVLLLGTGGYHPNERRHTACVMLPELGVVLDAGTAAFRIPAHVETGELDIYLTHAHLDHIVGLTYLIALEHEGAPVKSAVHARPEVLAAVKEHLFSEPLFPVCPIDRFEALSETHTLRAGGTLKTFALNHPGGSIGMRIDAQDKSLAYVTDTTALAPESIEAIRGVDLLIHEAYFPDASGDWPEKTGHTTARNAARAAKQAGAKRLVLVHADPKRADNSIELAEAREEFPTAEYGEDGLEIRL